MKKQWKKDEMDNGWQREKDKGIFYFIEKKRFQEVEGVGEKWICMRGQGAPNKAIFFSKNTL